MAVLTHGPVQGNILAPSPKRISLYPGMIPRRRKKNLTRLVRSHNYFRWYPDQWPILQWGKQIAMKFVKIPYCFHAFFERTTHNLHFPLCTAQDKAWLDTFLLQDKKKMGKFNKPSTHQQTEDVKKWESKRRSTDISWKIPCFQMTKVKLKYKKMWRKVIFRTFSMLLKL